MRHTSTFQCYSLSYLKIIREKLSELKEKRYQTITIRNKFFSFSEGQKFGDHKWIQSFTKHLNVH